MVRCDDGKDGGGGSSRGVGVVAVAVLVGPPSTLDDDDAHIEQSLRCYTERAALCCDDARWWKEKMVDGVAAAEADSLSLFSRRAAGA